MSPLNDRDLVLLVEEGEAVAPVIDDKAEDTKALWHAELVSICLSCVGFFR